MGKVLASLCALAISPAAMAEEAQPKWGAFLDVEGKVGTKRNIGEATFVPLLQDERTMLFGASMLVPFGSTSRAARCRSSPGRGYGSSSPTIRCRACGTAHVPLQAEPRRSSFTLQERRMTDAIVRDVDIVANTQVTMVSPAMTEVASATASGRPLAVINSASTSGSNLPTAVASVGANSTVVLLGTFNTTATTTLQPGQTLIGSGPINVRTPSGRSATAYLTGGATIACGTGSNVPTVAMASSSTLTGMTITLHCRAGVLHPGATISN